MAQILVRNLDDAVKETLRARAREHGRSLEEEVRVILTESVKDPSASTEPEFGLGTRIAQLFAGIDEPLEIPELRGGGLRVPDFSE